ncbi:MAG: MBL fold metallo-hydrolase [bacterium]|nr:MBL fold metallo-hydrolase [bacterium]
MASVDAGGGAHFRLGGLALDFGINPNLGVVAEAHLAKLIQSAINSPISDLLVSHFHWDHHGGVLPVLKAYLAQGIRLPRLVCTGITWGLLKPHLAMNGFLPDGPKEDPRSVQQAVRTEKITLIPNEHSVPGSVGASVQLANGKRIFYTGDFRRLDLPLRFSSPDLCILDCTGALKMEPTEEKEERIRENIMVLAKETLESPDASVYVSTFSTQLERICELERRCKKSTKHWPSLAGTSLLINTGAYREPLYGQRTERFVICSGVWAQPGSKLVRMSEERDMDYRLKRGDRVILAGSMPTWNRVLMPNITAMCERLTWMGVEVIVDSSLDLAHMPLLRRAEVHCSGHASFLEIVAFLQQLRPKSVFATHGSMEARRVVERYCRSQGIAVVSMNSSSEITC